MMLPKIFTKMIIINESMISLDFQMPVNFIGNSIDFLYHLDDRFAKSRMELPVRAS
jgi:hypothetical protein